jgi:hypothetical protein
MNRSDLRDAIPIVHDAVATLPEMKKAWLFHRYIVSGENSDIAFWGFW